MFGSKMFGNIKISIGIQLVGPSNKQWYKKNNDLINVFRLCLSNIYVCLRLVCFRTGVWCCQAETTGPCAALRSQYGKGEPELWASFLAPGSRRPDTPTTGKNYSHCKNYNLKPI